MGDTKSVESISSLREAKAVVLDRGPALATAAREYGSAALGSMQNDYAEIFDPSMWDNADSLGLPTGTAFPDDSVVEISGLVPTKDGHRPLTIRGLIPESFSESSRTKWGDIGQASFGFDEGKKLLLGLNIAETAASNPSVQGMLALLNITPEAQQNLLAGGTGLANSLLGFGLLSTTYRDVFEGSESLSLSVNMEFFMYPGAKDAYHAVYLPTRMLQGLQLPGVLATKMTIPKYIGIKVGNILKFEKDVVITGVSIDWGDKLDDEGYPTTSRISLDVRTAAVLLANDIAMQLKDRGKNRGKNATAK